MGSTTRKVDGLRVYLIHDGDPSYSALAVVARTRREALRLGYGVNDVGTRAGGWTSMRGHLMRDSEGNPAPLPPRTLQAGAVEFPSKGDADLARWFRNRGWWEEESDGCTRCERFPWSDVPESRLDPEFREVCRECGWPDEDEVEKSAEENA